MRYLRVLAHVLLVASHFTFALANVFDCSGDDACSGQNLTCNANEDCLVVCDGASSCANVQVNCPEGAHECRMECAGALACQGADVVCRTESQCQVRCAEDDVCDQATLLCPGTFTATATCELECEAPNACTDVTVNNRFLAPYRCDAEDTAWCPPIGGVCGTDWQCPASADTECAADIGGCRNQFPSFSPMATNAPTATPTLTPTPPPTPTPTPEATPSPTQSALPTPAPSPQATVSPDLAVSTGPDRCGALPTLANGDVTCPFELRAITTELETTTPVCAFACAETFDLVAAAQLQGRGDADAVGAVDAEIACALIDATNDRWAWIAADEWSLVADLVGAQIELEAGSGGNSSSSNATSSPALLADVQQYVVPRDEFPVCRSRRTIEDLQTVDWVTIIIAASITAFAVIMAILSKCVHRRSEFLDVFYANISYLDFVTDCLFVAQLATDSGAPRRFFWLSVGFLGFATCVSVGLVVHMIREEQRGRTATKWFRHHKCAVVSMILLSFPNLNFMKMLWTRAFGLESLSLPATFETKRRYSAFCLTMVALEDLPQMVILCIYSLRYVGLSTTALVSSAISVVSVAFSLATYTYSFGKAHRTVKRTESMRQLADLRLSSRSYIHDADSAAESAFSALTVAGGSSVSRGTARHLNLKDGGKGTLSRGASPHPSPHASPRTARRESLSDDQLSISEFSVSSSRSISSRTTTPPGFGAETLSISAVDTSLDHLPPSLFDTSSPPTMRRAASRRRMAKRSHSSAELSVSSVSSSEVSHSSPAAPPANAAAHPMERTGLNMPFTKGFGAKTIHFSTAPRGTPQPESGSERAPKPPRPPLASRSFSSKSVFSSRATPRSKAPPRRPPIPFRLPTPSSNGGPRTYTTPASPKSTPIAPPKPMLPMPMRPSLPRAKSTGNALLHGAASTSSSSKGGDVKRPLFPRTKSAENSALSREAPPRTLNQKFSSPPAFSRQTSTPAVLGGRRGGGKRAPLPRSPRNTLPLSATRGPGSSSVPAAHRARPPAPTSPKTLPRQTRR